MNVLGAAADDWVYQLSLAYREGTVKAYKQGVRRYLKFAFTVNELEDPHFFKIFVSSLQHRYKVIDAEREMRSQGVAGGTINTTMAGLERFVWFLVQDRLVDPDLYLSVVRPRQGWVTKPQTVPDPPRILSSGELRDLLEASCGENSDPSRYRNLWPIRDCAMVSVLLWTGMNPGELAALNMTSLELGSVYRTMTVLRISGDYRRSVPIPDELEDVLHRWQSERWERFGEPLSEGDPLFITNTNQRFSSSRLASLSKSWCQNAGIGPPKGGFFRAVRRACTSELEECGARQFEIRAWFGKAVSDSGLRRNEADLLEARLRVADLRPRPWLMGY